MTKLLLVEDDNNLREIYEARLQAEGYTIVSAHDGEEALVVAKAERPDLIISDVMMPKISGFEMLDILRNTDGLQDVKVIMLTALGQSDDQQRADKLGADRYLVKSQVTLEDIVKVAHDLLGDAGAAPATDAAGAPASGTPPAPTTTTEPAAVTSAPSPEPALSPEPSTAPVPAPAPAAEPSTASEPTAMAGAAPVAEPTLAEPPAASPIPVIDAPAAPASDDAAASTTVAEPTANEEATVEAQIEDFVAGASEPSTPAEAATPPPAVDTTAAESVSEPTPVSEQTPPIEASSDTPISNPDDPAKVEAADEKLVSDAAATLEASTKEAGDVAVDDKDAPENQPQQKKVGGERVIEPIAGEPKKDLDALLAIEEAKESQAQPPAPVIPVVVDNQKGPETSATPPTTTAAPNPNPSDKVDPSNIAL